jgi:hypothetical protein
MAPPASKKRGTASTRTLLGFPFQPFFEKPDFGTSSSYALLVLPDRDDINLQVLEAIARLVAQGAKVGGHRPSRTGGLADANLLDQKIKHLTAALWEDQARSTPASRLFAADCA